MLRHYLHMFYTCCTSAHIRGISSGHYFCVVGSRSDLSPSRCCLIQNGKPGPGPETRLNPFAASLRYGSARSNSLTEVTRGPDPGLSSSHLPGSRCQGQSVTAWQAKPPRAAPGPAPVTRDGVVLQTLGVLHLPLAASQTAPHTCTRAPLLLHGGPLAIRQRTTKLLNKQTGMPRPLPAKVDEALSSPRDNACSSFQFIQAMSPQAD